MEQLEQIGTNVQKVPKWYKLEQLGTKGYEKVQFPYPGVKRFVSIEGFKKFQKLTETYKKFQKLSARTKMSKNVQILFQTIQTVIQTIIQKMSENGSKKTSRK